jgi:hypothetical protein
MGEVSIELEGVAYRLRPSFEAIAEIEAGTGRDLFDLLRQVEQGGLSLDHIGVIVAACIRAQAKVDKDTGMATIKARTAARLVYEADGGALVAVRTALHPLLFNAVTGGYSALGERKAQTTTS